MSATYLWNRFWCAREESYRLTDDGFLEVLDDKYRAFTEVKTFADIADTPVLILLGEPGIGKTFALMAERESVEATVTPRGELILWPDLQAVSTPDTFDRAVVSTPELQAWLSGEAVLHLYLDALDECMLRVGTLGRLLTTVLQRGPSERLWLRLACRTAEWSNELENDLKRLLGAERVRAFELIPLTKRDVARAVSANGIDEWEFFEYVRRTGAAALASRPVPLDFLIRCFRRNDLPASQKDLYERGCLSLCEEPSEHRTETGLHPALTPSQRLAVAKRIAACSIFSTRPVILFGRDGLDVPADALRVNELAGGEERTIASTFELTEAGVTDALDTGLFTSRGAKVLGWAHHTYEEYLAARYVSDSSLSPHQILPLIIHPDDPDRKLTPQLHGIAAWLAMLHSEIFTYVVEHEPELLLKSDVIVERQQDRERIVANLLRRKREQSLAPIDFMALPKLRKLAHDDIADQLRPVLMDYTAPLDLRMYCADIAKHVECAALIPELAQIALDTAQPIDLRVHAAAAVVRIGNDEQRTALKPLLDGPGNSREERSLISLGIDAVWPHALLVEELFQILGGQLSHFSSISYDEILVEQIRERLTADHLPVALRWVLQRLRLNAEEIGNALQTLANAIIIAAWESGDDAITSALAEIAIEKMHQHQPLVTRGEFEEDAHPGLVSDTGQRRRFAAFLLPAIARSATPDFSWLISEDSAYLQRDDLPWLIERQGAPSQTTQEASVEAELIFRLANLTVPAIFDAVHSAASHNAVLAERLASYCAPISLDSEKARSMREYYSEPQESSERASLRASRKQMPPPIRVVDWLDATEQHPCKFWRLVEEMTRIETSRHIDQMSLDVQRFPGWLAASESTHSRIITAAGRFVRECDPKAESWFGTQEYTKSAVGGVRALMLLKSAAPTSFATLEPDIWRKWTPALIGIPNNDANVPLLRTAYTHAPDEVIRRIQQLVPSRKWYIVHKLSDVLDDALARAIVDVVRQGGMADDTVAELIEPLLAYPVARQFAEALVRDADTESSRRTAVAVAAKLLLHAPNESWQAFWPAMTTDVVFGRVVIERVVDQDRLHASSVHLLDEGRVAELYLWLCREYPPEQDVDHEDVYVPDTLDNIASWRWLCLDSLKCRGTQGACDALRRLAAGLPHQTYLLPIVAEAEATRREKSWQPTPVAVLRQLLADRSRRQVRSETELVDVILESLGRLQKDFQGETPAVVDVWNTKKPYTPRSENEFSDYVARHFRRDLKERGIIIGREVEIRRSTAPGSGERTDIHVDVGVYADGGPNPLSVIVETKGCWNRGVHGDMTAQLAHRYLRETHTRTGVFLIGWFHCPAWEKSHYRKADCIRGPALLAGALAGEAALLRAEGFDVRPFVLDCSLR